MNEYIHTSGCLMKGQQTNILHCRLSNMPCSLLHGTLSDITEWSEYVGVIMDSGLIESCIIYNMKGRVLACSSDDDSLLLHDGEAAHMVEALATPLSPDYKSLMVYGQHYDVLLNDGKHGLLLKSGIRHSTVCRTSKTLIVGLHKVNTNNEESSEAVMNLGDFLITKGM